ncbi:PaaI family thioesterase [Urechidicola sp. KH5]
MNKESLLAHVNQTVIKNTLMETLDIKMVEVGEDYLVASMPVNSKVHQPDGVLHGGATVALAETTGSFASHIFVDREKFKVRGLEISANHLKSISSGMVYATARPIHRGRTTHLWEIKITDEQENLISMCKLTVILLPKA